MTSQERSIQDVTSSICSLDVTDVFVPHCNVDSGIGGEQG